MTLQSRSGPSVTVASRWELSCTSHGEGDQIVEVDDQLAEIIALRDECKIGVIGISSLPLDLLRRALPAGIVCVQDAYSLLDRGHEEMQHGLEPFQQAPKT